MNNMKRMRGRNHRGGSGGGGGGGGIRHQSGNIPLNRNHVFDSSGPDLRIRGTAQQLYEKYLQLGRDATGGGDRVMAESYFQHAEHYFRIVCAMQAAQQIHQPQGGHAQGGHPSGQHQGGGNGQQGGRRFQQDGGDLPEDGQPDYLPPGYGDQPGAEQAVRDVPIASAPPEA